MRTPAAVGVGAFTTCLPTDRRTESALPASLLAVPLLRSSDHPAFAGTRCDDKKVDAYGEYVDAAKTRIAAVVPLYETREELRESHRSEEDLRDEPAEASRRWGRPSSGSCCSAGTTPSRQGTS
ncbi:hypothetical protein ACIQFU_34090 [Streptomyces sp. NPDC093065]|uniref:hypothetical protein n=1 Tax=Streptomyces sp. NPDC093065 TaxID=3366021 RepID=UPI003819D17B